jgi:hypothetical protein
MALSGVVVPRERKVAKHEAFAMGNNPCQENTVDTIQVKVSPTPGRTVAVLTQDPPPLKVTRPRMMWAQRMTRRVKSG